MVRVGEAVEGQPGTTMSGPLTTSLDPESSKSVHDTPPSPSIRLPPARLSPTVRFPARGITCALRQARSGGPARCPAALLGPRGQDRRNRDGDEQNRAREETRKRQCIREQIVLRQIEQLLTGRETSVPQHGDLLANHPSDRHYLRYDKSNGDAAHDPRARRTAQTQEDEDRADQQEDVDGVENRVRQKPPHGRSGPSQVSIGAARRGAQPERKGDQHPQHDEFPYQRRVLLSRTGRAIKGSRVDELGRAREVLSSYPSAEVERLVPLQLPPHPLLPAVRDSQGRDSSTLRVTPRTVLGLRFWPARGLR